MGKVVVKDLTEVELAALVARKRREGHSKEADDLEFHLRLLDRARDYADKDVTNYADPGKNALIPTLKSLLAARV